MVLSVSERTFAQEVFEASTPVLVHFSAPWCGLCRAIDPTLTTFDFIRQRAGTFLRTLAAVADHDRVAVGEEPLRLPLRALGPRPRKEHVEAGGVGLEARGVRRHVGGDVGEHAPRYLNRLSDLLFIVARNAPFAGVPYLLKELATSWKGAHRARRSRRRPGALHRRAHALPAHESQPHADGRPARR